MPASYILLTGSLFTRFPHMGLARVGSMLVGDEAGGHEHGFCGAQRRAMGPPAVAVQ